MIRKIKTWVFNWQFKNYYEGLLLGGLYDAKVRLLMDMKKNKTEYLSIYLDKGIKLSKQLISSVGTSIK